MRIWYADLLDFANPSRWNEVVPIEDMTLVQRLNSTFRASIYIGLIFMLIFGSEYWLYLPIVTAGITFAIYKSEMEGYNNPQNNTWNNPPTNSDVGCQRPTYDNPFMNPSIADIALNPERGPACPVHKVKDDIDRKFSSLFNELDDEYSRHSMMRSYYTVPSTTIPNKQREFADWLYKVDGKTCKDGDGTKCRYFARSV